MRPAGAVSSAGCTRSGEPARWRRCHSPGVALLLHVSVGALESDGLLDAQKQAGGIGAWAGNGHGREQESDIAAARADVLADDVIVGLEGATMLARARRDTAPLVQTGVMLGTVVCASVRDAERARP